MLTEGLSGTNRAPPVATNQNANPACPKRNKVVSLALFIAGVIAAVVTSSTALSIGAALTCHSSSKPSILAHHVLCAINPYTKVNGRHMIAPSLCGEAWAQLEGGGWVLPTCIIHTPIEYPPIFPLPWNESSQPNWT